MCVNITWRVMDLVCRVYWVHLYACKDIVFLKLFLVQRHKNMNSEWYSFTQDLCGKVVDDPWNTRIHHGSKFTDFMKSFMCAKNVVACAPTSNLLVPDVCLASVLPYAHILILIYLNTILCLNKALCLIHQQHQHVNSSNHYYHETYRGCSWLKHLKE